METLKILFSTSFYPPYHLGGDAIHVKYLAEELAKKGHEVHVLCSLDAYQIKRKNFNVSKQESDKKNIFVHRIKSPLNGINPLIVYVLGRSLYVQKKFSVLLKEVSPNIVHHHNISLLGYSILEKKNSYLSLYTAHDYWLICQTNNLLRNGRRICDKKQCYSCAIGSKRFPQLWRRFTSFKRAVRSIDLLISPSDFVRRRLSQEIEVKSLTLPNFAPNPPAGIPPTGFSNYFLFAGLLEKHKGILNLLNLFNENRHDLKARLVIAGGGSLENYVHNYIEKNSLGKIISFLGFVDQKKLYALYSNALALIVPSICPENAPLVVLEALSVGTPVIVSNTGGLPEIMKKVDAKLIFNDIDHLKDIILSFSEKDFSSSKIKQICEQNFSSEAYVNNYIRIVKNISG